MPFAFGHLIGAWIVGKVYEWKTNKKISHTAWFFLLVGGILPDIDFLLEWTTSLQVHRTFTHSILASVIAGIILYSIFSLQHNPKAKQYALALSCGILIHVLLDSIMGSGAPWFWPLPYTFSLEEVFVGTIISGPFPSSSIQVMQASIKAAIIDMAMGITWIFFLWWKKRIQF